MYIACIIDRRRTRLRMHSNSQEEKKNETQLVNYKMYVRYKLNENYINVIFSTIVIKYDKCVALVAWCELRACPVPTCNNRPKDTPEEERQRFHGGWAASEASWRRWTIIVSMRWRLTVPAMINDISNVPLSPLFLSRSLFPFSRRPFLPLPILHAVPPQIHPCWVLGLGTRVPRPSRPRAARREYIRRAREVNTARKQMLDR